MILHPAVRTPEIAEESAAKVSELYDQYKEHDDFVGMDMARKFLQMGYTRAMRYAKHKGGRKYDSNHELLPETVNEEKVKCAQVVMSASNARALRALHCATRHSNLGRSPANWMQTRHACDHFKLQLMVQKFRVVWKAVEADPEYQQMKAKHKAIEKQQKAAA